MGLRIGALIIDARDPGRLARFWAQALDWVISRDQDPEWVVEPPAGSREAVDGATGEGAPGDIPVP